MPIYVFRCTRCRHEQEEIQSFDDAAPSHCNETMNRVPTAASFAFVTKGGNLFNFSPSHGRVTKGNKKQGVKTIGHGHGLGGVKGRRPPTAPKAET